MGAVYNIKCPRCGWAHSFCLGAGICDERRANEALLALETGPDADNVQAILLSEPDALMYIERGAYRCRVRNRRCLSSSRRSISMTIGSRSSRRSSPDAAAAAAR